jgi:hypothetical protein
MLSLSEMPLAVIHRPQLLHRIVVVSEEIFTQAKRENFEIPDSLY